MTQQQCEVMGGPEEIEVHKVGCVLETESTGLRKRMRERKSSGQSDIL